MPSHSTSQNQVEFVFLRCIWIWLVQLWHCFLAWYTWYLGLSHWCFVLWWYGWFFPMLYWAGISDPERTLTQKRCPGLHRKIHLRDKPELLHPVQVMLLIKVNLPRHSLRGLQNQSTSPSCCLNGFKINSSYPWTISLLWSLRPYVCKTTHSYFNNDE
jgi:hypothetical protein